MKKKTLSVLSAVTMSIALLGACSSTSTTSSNGNNSETPKTVSFYHDRTDWQKNINDLGQIMQKSGVGIKGVPYADVTSYQSTVRSALHTDKAPPLFKWWSGYQMKSLVDAGLLEDLTDQWKNVYEKEGVSPDIAKAFTFNGKIYGAPLLTAYWVVYYNKHVFEQNGLQPPKTWEEFMKINETLKSKGITPIAQTVTGEWPGFIWFEQLLVGSNPDLYNNLVEGKAKYTDPGVVSVMKLWKDMMDKGYFTKPEDYNTGIPQDFAKGKAAMTLFGQWYASTLNQAGLKPGTDYGTFLLPSVDPSVGNVAIFETNPILVSKASPDKKAAVNALNNFMGVKTQQKWDDMQGFAPDVNGVTTADPNIKEIQQSIKDFKLIQRYWEATPPAISQFASNQFDKFILNPSSYQDVLNAIQQYAEQQWKSNPSGS